MTFPFKIALAQLNPIVGHLGYNQEIILNALRDCDDDTDILVTPELSITGYTPQDLIIKDCFQSEVDFNLSEIVKATKDIETAIIVGAPYRQGEAIFNAAHFIHRGKILATRLKHHLPNYGVFDEKRYFSKGPLPDPVNFKGYQIGILICEDLWHMDVAAHLKGLGAQMLLVPNGSPYENGKHQTRQYFAKLRAQETALPLVYVNQTGGQDELVYDGGSFVLNEKGETTLQMPFFDEALAYSNDENTQEFRQPEPHEKIYRALVTGTRDYVRKNGFEKVILGLSGGIDSAMVAAIACDALGSENVHCVMMPSPFTSEESLEDAKQCAAFLGVKYEIIPIKAPLEAYENTISLKGLAHENIQSRIRGTILMALSNDTSALLLATGNKSEMACGYATLYGDMNGAYNPLKDVYKTRVFELAKWRNAERRVIPERIITKPPSAELRHDQKDEDSLPPYDVLDDALIALVEEGRGIKDLIESGYERQSIIHIWKLLKRAEYKRFQSPPGPKITSTAFGTDRRMPMTDGFLRDLKE